MQDVARLVALQLLRGGHGQVINTISGVIILHPGDMDRYASDEEEGSGDNQRRKRRTGERSVFDRFIGE